jgi:rubredoxin
MAKCIVKQRDIDGSEKIVAIIEGDPMVAEVLRIGFNNKLRGMSMFMVEAIPEIKGTDFFEKLIKQHKEKWLGASVKFVCPDCKGTVLECCEDGPYNSEVLNIDTEGDFDYGKISASGIVERFQCAGCGYVLKYQHEGFAAYELTDTDEVVEWITDNCEQGE